ncbi:MAG: type VI secretion system membrane subunit TssM, partial [Gammaproteobacteria bacterium]|nr:type VI secretion system membrane subunit TssM [Gammaproteobacteria bacterium]
MVFKGIEATPDDTVFVACENVRLNVGDAVNFLKETFANNDTGFRAFHHMPWYLLIGPENSGKTRLLSQSQLTFLETERFVQLTPSRVNTSGNINWWFTPHATLLDVPGNFLEPSVGGNSGAQHAAWLELLKQLKRVRPRRPVNGVILAVDVHTLSQPIEQLTKLLRDRLQEIAFRLKQSFPVYLVCTQADRILGFNEYFDDLGQNEREQYLGVTFPLYFNQKNSPAELFSQTFDQLLKNLHQRALWRIHHERDQNKRKLIQHFPYQLNSIKENLQRLVYSLGTSSYHLAIRGVYFTGTSTDEDATVNTINDNIEKSFALLPVTHSHTETGYAPAQKAYFIKQLLNERIFCESSAVRDALRAPTSRRDQFLRFAALGLASLGLLSITLFWSHQYENQKQYLTQASHALSSYRLLNLAYNPHPVDLTTLVPSLNALNLAQNSAQQAHLPWLLRLQLHHKKSIGGLTHSLYQTELQTKLIPAVRDTLVSQMQSNNTTDSAQLYSLFRTYLMLGDPAQANKQALTLWFSRDWQNPATRNPQFMGHLDAALQNPLPPLQNNPALITQMRANLNALPYGLLAEAILRTKILPKPTQPLTLSQQHIFTLPSEGIPEIYTANALSQIDNEINNSLSEAIEGNWVLGKKTAPSLSPNDIASLKQELMDSFAQNYVTAWQSWLNGINMSAFSTTGSLEMGLQELTSEHSPLKTLLIAISKNTNLTGVRGNDPAFIGTLKNNLSIPFAAFSTFSSPKALNTLLGTLKTLQTELHQQTSTAKTIATLIATAKTAPVPLNRWIYNITESQRNLSVQHWEQQIYPSGHSLLDNHYPFSATAKETVSLKTFEVYFAQGGILNHYFTESLSPYVNILNPQWQWENTNTNFAQQNATTLLQFERANIIHQLYFNNKNELSVPFTFTLT